METQPTSREVTGGVGIRVAADTLRAQFGCDASNGFTSMRCLLELTAPDNEHDIRHDWNVEEPVTAILREEGTADERAAFWTSAMEAGALPGVTTCATYDHDTWQADILRVLDSDNASELLTSNAYLFFAAAEYHRNYLLKRLLPSFGLLVK